ncbi:hypothetical protein OB955_20385 [Halobacteria archaeon AArc-m2/3/4]|uniref:Uncharacterized protein n=1 Tax=Natronoglomus mannanivorans TaxID=2979990 RepID=A0ABT2QJJ9_9EURY|nr:hypothetical protein [Halobacteria archaeon AArc-m2/3/4]
MKTGASDPFAQDDQDGQSNDSDEPASHTEESDQTKNDDVEQADKDENATHSGSNTGQFDRSDLPYTLRRDTVKDERDSVHQLFVLDETDDKARDAERDLEDRFGDMYRLDAREAIYLAGMQNLDDAESILREWGYDF